MVWRALIILFSLSLSAATCSPEMQLIEICEFDITAKQCHCAMGNEKYDKPLEYCDKFLGMSAENVRRIGQRLEKCKQLEETCETKKVKNAVSDLLDVKASL